MKKQTLLALFIITSLYLSAQIEGFVKMEWGEVPQSDLDMKVYSFDSTAQAVVLGVEGRMHVNKGDRSFEYTLVKHKRIKILDKSAVVEYGDVTIFYYHKNDLENIRKIRAQTISTDGYIREVNAKEIYREKINDRWTKITFAFPNVEVGSVLEYRYQLNSDRAIIPDEWTFREEIPVRSSYFKFRNNAPMNFTYQLRGGEFMPYEKLDNGIDHFSVDDMHIWIKGTDFLMKHGAALSEEPYMTTLDDYRITIRFQCSEYKVNGRVESVLNSWEETAKDLLLSERLGFQFSKHGRSNKVIAASEGVIDTEAEPLDKLFQITQFVSSNIKWDGTYGIYTNIRPNDAFQQHEASIPAIQYTGLALLHHYGFEAYPVILSTRDNGAMITGFPFIDQFNYVIILIIMDGKLKLVDMSSPLLPIGILRKEALNKKGFLLNKDDPQWINIGLPVFQNIYAIKAEIHADASISAEMKSTMQAYSARTDRNELNNAALEEIWQNRLPQGAIINEVACENIENIRKPLITSLKFDIPEAGFANGDMIYLSPIIYTEFEENPFKLENRSFPIDFPYPFEEKSIYNYTIPEGYQVEAIPEKIDVRLPNLDAVFQYMIQERGDKIQIAMILRVKKTVFSPDEYSALRDLFESAMEKMGEQIVLKKME